MGCSHATNDFRAFPLILLHGSVTEVRIIGRGDSRFGRRKIVEKRNVRDILASQAGLPSAISRRRKSG